MSQHQRTSSPRPRRRAVRQRRAGALLALTAAATGAIAAGTLSANARRSPTALVVGGRTVATIPAGTPAAARARAVPALVRVRRGAAEYVFAVDRRRTAAILAGRAAGAVSLPARRVAVRVGAPVIAQRLPNNCETAALQVLLASVGVRADQLALQRQLARSGPLDPVAGPDGPVWGDPETGYVGRADGTGPWGGFGVYPGPVAALAARRGVRLEDLTGARPSVLYRTLLEGRAVEAWIGLGDGPYREWTTPAGRPVRVNLNEHTVVLTGLRRDGRLELVNVLQGTREVWTRARFEQAWALLGRRALAPARGAA